MWTYFFVFGFLQKLPLNASVCQIKHIVATAKIIRHCASAKGFFETLDVGFIILTSFSSVHTMIIANL